MEFTRRPGLRGRRCSTRPSCASRARTATRRRSRPGRPRRSSRSAAASPTRCSSTCCSTARASWARPGRSATSSTRCSRSPKFQGDTHQPYYVHAYWGRFSFRGILTQVDVTYKLFDRAGEPLRATVKLTLKEALSPEEVAGRGPPRPRRTSTRPGWSATASARRHRRHRSTATRRTGARSRRPTGCANPRGLAAGQTAHPAAARAAHGARDEPLRRPRSPTARRSRSASTARRSSRSVAADVVEIDVHEEVGPPRALHPAGAELGRRHPHRAPQRRRPVRARRRLAVLARLPRRADPVFDGVIASLTTHFPGRRPAGPARRGAVAVDPARAPAAVAAARGRHRRRRRRPRSPPTTR